MPTKQLIGTCVGQLTIIARAGSDVRRNALWKCRCTCGNVTTVPTKHLISGNTKSCGCLNPTIKLNRLGIQLGLGSISTHPLYATFRSAKARCTNPKSDKYKNYGGRGIKFKFKDFIEFVTALGERPSKLHTVDRIDNNGHYEPGNVRWATRSIQNKNQRPKIQFQSTAYLKARVAKLKLELSKLESELRRRRKLY